MVDWKRNKSRANEKISHNISLVWMQKQKQTQAWANENFYHSTNTDEMVGMDSDAASLCTHLSKTDDNVCHNKCMVPLESRKPADGTTRSDGKDGWKESLLTTCSRDTFFSWRREGSGEDRETIIEPSWLDASLHLLSFERHRLSNVECRMLKRAFLVVQVLSRLGCILESQGY